MTNIVERLRMEHHSSNWPLCSEAAEEIERLRWENREMRRTFGSHPLFKEKDAEIERLRRLQEHDTKLLIKANEEIERLRKC